MPRKSSIPRTPRRTYRKKSGVGSGAYNLTDLKKAVKSVVKGTLVTAGRAGGAFLGGKVGYAKQGASLGGAFGGKLSQMIGSGAYVSNAHATTYNSLINNGPPSFQNYSLKNGDIVLEHREYITDVLTASTANTFNNQNFLINAGLDTTFPYLSQIACNFGEYQFISLVFEFKSTSSDSIISSGSSSSLGSVIMATNMSVLDPLYKTKYEMDSAYASNSEKPSACILHGVECMAKENINQNYLVRSGSVNNSITSYDMGNFQLGTINALPSQNIGELYVYYRVVLRKPRLFSSLGNFNNYASFTASAQSTASTNAAAYVINSTSTFQPVVSMPSANNLRLTLPTNIQTGTYVLQVNSVYATGVAGTLNMIQSGSSNITNVNIYNGGTLSRIQTPTSATFALGYSFLYCFSVSYIPTTVTFVNIGPLLPVGVVDATIFASLTQIPSLITN